MGIAISVQLYGNGMRVEYLTLLLKKRIEK
jgi:hypothetical protein